MKTRNSGISLVLYSSDDDRHLKRVLASVSDFFAKDQVILCADVQTLGSALQKLLSGYGIVLMLIRSLYEVETMMPIRDRLMDQSVILILDNSREDLTQQVLKLYPRYTSSFKDDYGDVFLVLDKMISKIETTIRRQDNG